MSDRREFLKFLAGSPLLLAYPTLLEAITQAPTSQAAVASLASAADALDVYDFEAMARRVLPPAHWGYMATGVDGEETLRANPRGFDRYQLRVRRFVDVSRIDMGMELFGHKFTSPVMLCPVGSQRAFHAEGELAVARAAQARGQLQILSTQSSTPIEDVAKARQRLVVPALHHEQLGRHREAAEACRDGGMSRGGDYRRFAGRTQYRDRRANGTRRHARVRQLSRRGRPSG
jgi:4-hydroxymandelate oxidase